MDAGDFEQFVLERPDEAVLILDKCFDRLADFYGRSHSGRMVRALATQVYILRMAIIGAEELEEGQEGRGC